MKEYLAYAILGVTKDASQSEIKKAYKKLAMKHHPDKNGGSDHAKAKFQELQEAYRTLSSESGKSENDRTNSSWRSYEYEDFFNDGTIYGFKKKAPPKQDCKFQLTLESAYTGKVISYNGKEVRIPAGIRNGTKMFVDGVLLEITIPSHAKFKRTLDDLLVDVNISAIEAMLGVNITLTHLDGAKFRFKVLPGTQNGQVIRLSNKGMPNPELDKTGDLLVRCNVFIPDHLSLEEVSQLKELIRWNRKTIEL